MEEVIIENEANFSELVIEQEEQTFSVSEKIWAAQSTARFYENLQKGLISPLTSHKGQSSNG